MSKKDYLILLGDVGVCWDGGIRDQELINILQSLPVTTLFIDGNHEHHSLLASYPVSEWCGGKAHVINENIIHLMRGQVFKIDGLKFFTMGGAVSRDKMFRTEGVTWFKEELPTIDEFEEGEKNLAKNQYKVDYILTHTAPRNIALAFRDDILEDEEPFLLYLQDIANRVQFKYWLFGHFHKDVKLNNFICLYDKFIRIKGKKGKNNG